MRVTVWGIASDDRKFPTKKNTSKRYSLLYSVNFIEFIPFLQSFRNGAAPKTCFSPLAVFFYATRVAVIGNIKLIFCPRPMRRALLKASF